MKYHSLKQRFEPYSDVLVFMVTLLVANYFWKFTVIGDEAGEQVTWFGWDITAPFEFMARHVAAVVYWCVSLFNDRVYMADEHTIRFANGVGTTIIWGCSGLKQMFIWFWLIATVRPLLVFRRASDSISPMPLVLAKLWYIPLGWVGCYLFNILRIVWITLLIEHHPEWFHPLHDYLFKYLFYAMLFGLWVLFVEKIRPVVLPQPTC